MFKWFFSRPGDGQTAVKVDRLEASLKLLDEELTVIKRDINRIERKVYRSRGNGHEPAAVQGFFSPGSPQEALRQMYGEKED